MSDNRRASPRVSLDVVVNCGQNAIAHSRDISEGGLCLIVEQPMESGKMLHLSLTLPGQSRRIDSFGKVAWSRKAMTQHHLVGVQFWEIKEADKSAILEYLRQKLEV